MRFTFLLLSVFTLLIGQNSFAQDSLRVGYVNSAPFIYEENDKLQGPISWLWYNVSEDNNFHCEYIRLESIELLQELENGTIDLALYPLTITSNRTKVIDFSVPFYLAHSGLVTKESSSWDRTMLFLESFFSFNFFSALGSLILILFIFGFLTWRFERIGNEEEFGDGINGLWSGFWWAAVTMTTVGYGDKSPKTTGGRIVALIWMFTAVIIISGLTASIASSLTVTELESRSNDIATFKKRKLGTVQTSSSHEWMKDNFYNNSKLYERKEDLLPALLNGEVEAVVYDLPLLREMVKSDTANKFDVLPLTFNPQYYAIGMKPNINDTLKKKINTFLLKHTESLEWKVVLGEYDLMVE
ncbi:transporter substrate-binding domain-containing protein [Brumimicrobium glaciale]|uniref:Transporter substrate-binding domain-containing protein n=2 Tax=Brumimicrobium glaciale TaxID=200475 RepID=A0A4Q4KH61_9FLAO|nr:transporter substrate-binding domain-containing protein [Brumimicrobium glaciale]